MHGIAGVANRRTMLARTRFGYIAVEPWLHSLLAAKLTQIDTEPQKAKRGDAYARSILCFAVRNMICQQKAAPNHIVDYYFQLKKDPIPNRIRS
ncbi:hypothetical protein ACFFLI_03140 [Lactiplantibacillus modestisalitolerans]|uniref:Transposase n=1 Tax=Lactiplantibacillus modestisalitolerans TaxID=1457219 RepID=A0ABV5WSI1_9LACO|nr:hypothetical protein [Lactiplantibacillus modestisalitolerans]